MKRTFSSNKKELGFAIFLDCLVTIVAWSLAYYLRFHVSSKNESLFLNFLCYAPALVLLNVFFHHKVQCYDFNDFIPWHKRLNAWLSGLFRGYVVFIFFYYYTHREPISRVALVYYILIAVILQFVLLAIIRSYVKKKNKRGKLQHNILVIGHNAQIREFLESLFPLQSGNTVVGWLDADNPACEKIAETHNIDLLTIDNLIELNSLVKTKNVTHVFIGFLAPKLKKMTDYIEAFSAIYCHVYLVPVVSSSILGYSTEEINRHAVIHLNTSHNTRGTIILKRVVDIVGSIFGLLIFSPIFLILTVLVKISSSGPIFYGQERVTLEGALFTMWKFRSMRIGAEDKSGPVWATANDSRVTRLGRFMRRTSLDEIPQFWNVLTGDLSLVGPRPERPVFVKKFENEIPGYGIRHRVKAGVTGWAQVNGLRGDTSIAERSRYDNQYARNWNLMWDLHIILLTFVHGFFDENAY